MSWKVRPWVRRLFTRALAIIPAVIVIGIYGDNRVNDLLNVSQVVLGIQLPFAMVPLMYFTCNRRIMGKFVNPLWLRVAGWGCAGLITGLDVYYLATQVFGM